MQPVSYWVFIWRSIDRATAETAAFFGLDLKTGLTTIGLIALGFLIHWRVRGAVETKEEAAKYVILVAAPFILFMAGLFLYNMSRAPYLVYLLSVSDAQNQLASASTARQNAEDKLAAVERENKGREETIDDLKKQLAEKNHSRKEPVQPLQSPPAPTPNLASIRIASQKQVPSTDPNLPYALEVIVQTDAAIEPVAFVVICNGAIGSGSAGFTNGGAYMKSKQGVAQDPRGFVFEWESPAFTPDKPILVRLLSKTYIKAIELQRINYIWP